MVEEMPFGWRLARFDDILTKVDRKFIIDDDQEYKTVGVRWYGNGAFVRQRLLGASINRKQQWKIQAGDIVYNKLFAWKGAFAIADESVNGCIVSDKFPTYNVKPDLIEPKYLSYFFATPTIALQAQDLSKGAAALSKLTLNPPQFWDLTIPLPPLSEQRRIVERAEALASRIAKAQLLRDEASLEVDYLYGREVAELFTNAKDWQTYNLGELTTDVSYGTSEKAHSERTGTPVLRMGNIQSGKLDLSDMKYMHPSQQEIRKLTLQKGDILVNRTNSAELVGKCAVFDLDGDYLFASYIIRLRIDPQKANPYLVAEYINSPLGRAYMFAERKQMTGQANVNSQKLRALPIKLPPLDEQRRIVAYLDSVQARLRSLRELQSETQEELDALLPSVLDKAFKGEL